MFHELLSHRNGSVGNAKIETLIKEITSNFVTDAAMKDRMEKWSENLRQEFEQEVQVMVTEKIRENFREKVETFEDAVYQRVSEDLTKVKPAFSKEEIARIVQVFTFWNFFYFYLKKITAEVSNSQTSILCSNYKNSGN